MTETAIQQSDMDELFELEYRYCREPVFCDMGRYVHILCQKPVNPIESGSTGSYLY